MEQDDHYIGGMVSSSDIAVFNYLLLEHQLVRYIIKHQH